MDNNERKEYEKQYRELHKAKIKEYQGRYRAEHNDKRRNYQHEYRVKNKEKSLSYQKEYRKNNFGIISQKSRIYGQVNKKALRIKANERRRQRMKTDIMFKLLHNLRRRLGLIVEGKRKAETTRKLIGCDLQFFKEHLENKFDSKMNWDNYGKYWEIDHITPCKSFNMNEESEQKKCFHFTNLQPLTSVYNRSKGAKILQ